MTDDEDEPAEVVIYCAKCSGREFSWPPQSPYILEHADGTPADPPTFRTVPNWQAGDVIPLPHRSLRVVEVRDDDADRAPTLVSKRVA
jgi:hypothetical protein